MIYASRTPESMNTDPNPWRCNLGDVDRQCRHPRQDVAHILARNIGGAYSPRPEFTPATTHPANPILVQLRGYGTDPDEVEGFYGMLGRFESFGGLVSDPDTGIEAFKNATAEQRVHAARVLSRLTGL